jgi:hypothetical protein
MLWHVWRGSLELLAHVVRVALKSVGRDGQAEGTCLIDLMDLEDDVGEIARLRLAEALRSQLAG